MQNQSRKRQQRTEAQEWCFRLRNDPELAALPSLP
jgi:hypothetical protein